MQMGVEPARCVTHPQLNDRGDIFKMYATYTFKWSKYLINGSYIFLYILHLNKTKDVFFVLFCFVSFFPRQKIFWKVKTRNLQEAAPSHPIAKSCVRAGVCNYNSTTRSHGSYRSLKCLKVIEFTTAFSRP